ncbi:Yip1 family protein [Senegalia sp. (in: firmicutes)]|uniref:Yip1 family protein n=1 Tax=Senegalia sp. (in: firmicutes) TaxID=1924098 RepID=UPI003F95F9B5
MNEENERDLIMEDEKVSLGQKIKWYITKPSRFFEEFKKNPKILIHFIIITILSAVTAVIAGTKTDEITNQALEGLSGEQLEATQNIVGIFSSPAFLILGTILMLTLTYLISAFFRYIFTKLFKGQGKFKEMFAIVIVSSYPVVIAGVIQSLFSNPSADATTMDSILSVVNIWSIWQLVLLIVGIKVLFNISMKKSALINIGIFLVTTLFVVGSAIINNNLSNMVQ